MTDQQNPDPRNRFVWKQGDTMILPSSAVSQFINDLWPLAFHEESVYTQGKCRDVWFTHDGERYSMDFSHCGNRSDWYQFDSHQDAWYYGQWVNPVTKQILSYVEGDITLITCETAAIYRKELQSLTDFEGRNGLDDLDGRHWEKLQQEDTPILKASTLDLYKDIPQPQNQNKTRHPAGDKTKKSDINEMAPGEDAPRAGESETSPVNRKVKRRESLMNSKAQTKTDVNVKLIGQDGNAFYILGTVTKALKQAGYDRDFIQQFQDTATSGDYNHLLATVMEYVIVE